MKDQQVFTISKHLLLRRQRIFAALMSIVVLLPLGALLVVAGLYLDRFMRGVPFLIPMMLIPAIIGVFVNRSLVRQWKQQLLILTPTALECAQPQRQTRIRWQDVEHIFVHKHHNGQISTIAVTPKTGTTLTLFEFESMADILGGIEQHIPPTIPIEIKG